MNISYTITLLISLYGGIAMIVRTFAKLLSTILLKFKCHLPTNSIRKLIQWLKRLNLFKSIHNRTKDDVAQQRIITRVYLFLLLSKI